MTKIAMGPRLCRWYVKCNLREYGVSRRSVLRTYFVAASSIFEPDRSSERLAWARTAVLMEAVSTHFSTNVGTFEHSRAFFEKFISIRYGSVPNSSSIEKGCGVVS